MVREAKVLISSRNKITYTLEIKQVKNINLRITREGAVRVSANPFVPLPQIDEFVDSRAEWMCTASRRCAKKTGSSCWGIH